MVSESVARCLDCRFLGKKGATVFECLHPLVKKRNRIRQAPFVLQKYEVVVSTKCQMIEARRR